ncbi:MAG: nitroreductase family protein [Candidatus Eisenbacteria bacterium]
MDLYELLTNRRSVRHFEDRPVEDELLNELLDAAANAPSGGNIQPVSIIVVREPERRRRLSEIVGDQPWVRNAPVSLVFCVDFERVRRWAGLSGVSFRGSESAASFLIAYADLMCAAQTVAILAEDRGLGSVYVGTILTQMGHAADLLDLPGGVLPLMVLTLGYPASRPTGIPKLPGSVLAHDERYSAPTDAELGRAFEAKYGTIDENVDRYLERAYVEVVEADKQHDDDWTADAKARMDRLNIRSNAQFLFELRYPQDVMVALNDSLLSDFAGAGFVFPGFTRDVGEEDARRGAGDAAPG